MSVAKGEHLPPAEPTVVLDPKEKHTATIIWLHGLGSSGPGWYFLAEALSTELPHVRFVLPTSPRRMVGGQVVNGWCDCPPPPTEHTPEPWRRLPFDMTMPEDAEGMIDSVATIAKLTKEEAERDEIGFERVIVAGFSQGGLISLLSGLISKHKLAGAACCSGWLGLKQKNKIDEMISKHAVDTPIFWGHGEKDEVIGYWMAEAGLKELAELGVKKHLEFHGYPNQTHVVSEEEVAHLLAWIKKLLPDDNGDKEDGGRKRDEL